jgi:hypothetical protein
MKPATSPVPGMLSPTSPTPLAATHSQFGHASHNHKAEQRLPTRIRSAKTSIRGRTCSRTLEGNPILAAARQPLDRRGVLPAVLDDGDSRPGHPRRRDYAGHEKLATRLGGHFTRSDENRQRQPDTEGIENTLIRTSDGNVIFSLGLFGDGISVTDAKYQIFAADAGLKYRGCRSRASSTGARCRSCVVREPRCRRFGAVQ